MEIEVNGNKYLLPFVIISGLVYDSHAEENYKHSHFLRDKDHLTMLNSYAALLAKCEKQENALHKCINALERAWDNGTIDAMTRSDMMDAIAAAKAAKEEVNKDV